MSALSSDDDGDSAQEFDGHHKSERSSRLLSLEKRYHSKLSFVSHNRASSLADAIPDLHALRRTESAPSEMLSNGSLPHHPYKAELSNLVPLQDRRSSTSSRITDEDDTQDASILNAPSLRRNSSLKSQYGVRMVASRNRGSNGSAGSSGLSDEIRRHAARESVDSLPLSVPASPDVPRRLSDNRNEERTPTNARRRSRESSPSASLKTSSSPRISLPPSPTTLRRHDSHSHKKGSPHSLSSSRRGARASPPTSPSPSRASSISRAHTDAAATIATILRERRRQASMPYSGHGQPDSLVHDGHSGQPDPLQRPAARRQRSRHATRLNSLAMSSPPAEPSVNIAAALDGYPWYSSSAANSDWPDAPSRDILMTPTTEEWTSYGGHVGSRLHLGRGKSTTSLKSLGSSSKSVSHKNGIQRSPSPSDSESDSESNTSSTSTDDNDDATNQYTQTASHKTKSAWTDQVKPHPSMARYKSWSSFGLGPKTPAGFDHPAQPLSPTESSHGKASFRASGYVAPHTAAQEPHTGLALFTAGRSSLDGEEEALPLLPGGPIDPRKYSARTGARSIHSFSIQGESGKGAYGSVVKAREYARDQFTEKDPEIIIKYIVKQRILADCWKKHKILGPIPVEIHVLDHLRRIPYVNMLPPEEIASSPKAQIQITGHPNVCSMLDFFEDAEHYYLCMPCCGNGKDLFDHVEMFPDGLPLKEVQSITTQIASAVAFLHMHGIVHRDIKDENVTLDGNGLVQLIDFGSAAYIKEGRKFDTFSGTLDFAAPEVLRGERYDGKETDIWALGVLLYVLICGECPFWNSEEATLGLGDSTRAASALRNKLQPVGVAKETDHLLADAIDLVRRCLEIDAADRPNASQVCRHWFIMRQFSSQYTHNAWRGKRGWQAVE